MNRTGDALTVGDFSSDTGEVFPARSGSAGSHPHVFFLVASGLCSSAVLEQVVAGQALVTVSPVFSPVFSAPDVKHIKNKTKRISIFSSVNLATMSSRSDFPIYY